MSVTEIKQAIGEWSLNLRPETPREILDALTYFGHVAIVPGKSNPREIGDNLLLAARYVGVYRGRSAADDFQLRGGGMALWLGDEDDKGDVFETPVTFTAATFAATIAGLLPPGGAVTAGTIGSVPGTYTGVHQWQTPRQALTYVTDTYSSPSAPVEWRVTNDGKLDANYVSNMYQTTPRALLVRKDSGRDLNTVMYRGRMDLDRNADDYTTRVVILAEGEGSSIATGSANTGVVPYKDIHGNTVKMTRLSSESETSAANANTRAQLMLNRFQTPTASVQLSAAAYDIKSDFVVGDYIDVYDAANGFVDSNRERYWKGERLNPVAIRCVEMTWPIVSGWTVAFRDANGVWIDLSPWYVPESGDTTIVVGDLPSSLTGSGGSLDFRPNIGGPDSTIPGVPTFNTPFASAAYQSARINDARAAVYITWNQPLNVDSSTITDGDHYTVRYRVTAQYNYPITWAQAASFRWNLLQTWGRPLSNPAVTANDWNYIDVGWDKNSLTINELMVATEYEFQIRASDNANPPNSGAWSASVLYTTTSDVIAPSAPAAPSVASSLIALQITHQLGKATGGTFNLENDLDHLEIHVGAQFFAPDDSTLVGKIQANAGNLLGKIPVVATFQIPNTTDVWVKVVAVDGWGNKSGPSAAVQASADLIDDEHISTLTASKITAGTISADLLLAGSIRTADTGQRAELNYQGLQLYDENGELQVNLTADAGSPNFLTFGPTDSALATISDTGDVTGQVLSAATDVVIGGESFTDDIRPTIPKGIVAYGSDDAVTANFTAERGFFEVSFVADSTRNYRISCTMWLAQSVADGTATIQIRDGGSVAPTIASSPNIASFSHGFKVNNIGESFEGAAVLNFTDGLHRLLITIKRQSGTGNIIITSTPVQPLQLIIEDLGPVDVANTKVDNDGGGGTTPPAVTNYTKTYNATWSQTYDGSNNQKTGSTIDQGQYDSAGNRRGLIGFDWATIKNDLSGANITGVWITMYAEHWYYNNGGTGIIGTHNYSSKPSKWSSGSVNDNRFSSPNWPRGSKRKVAMSVAIGNEFKAGTTKGIAIGPGPSTNLIYYGKFSDYADTNKPVLTIAYSK